MLLLLHQQWFGDLLLFHQSLTDNGEKFVLNTREIILLTMFWMESFVFIGSRWEKLHFYDFIIYIARRWNFNSAHFFCFISLLQPTSKWKSGNLWFSLHLNVFTFCSVFFFRYSSCFYLIKFTVFEFSINVHTMGMKTIQFKPISSCIN